MAAALAGVLPEATAATPGVETAAAQAGKGPVATGQPKKQRGVALRRSAQAALEASSRPVEASRGPFGPLTPKRARTEDLLNKTESQSPLDNVAAGSTGQPTGGLYRPDLCCIAEPMPRPQAEAELAANTTHTPTLALAAPCVHLSAISGAAAACVSELQAAMTQLASGLEQPAATVCHNPAESAAASPLPPCAAPPAPAAPAAPAVPADAVDAAAGCTEPLGALTAPCPARSTAPLSTAPSVFQVAVDGGSCSPATAARRTRRRRCTHRTRHTHRACRAPVTPAAPTTQPTPTAPSINLGEHVLAHPWA